MNSRPNTRKPPILYGAYLLAALSLAWSGFAITDLMQSGKFGLSVALAGDIGWITILWAEHKGITIAGRRWPVIATGWAIAAGVAALLVVHGQQHGGPAQAVAGPFVVAVGKIVWAIALEALRDRTAPTPEQTAEIETMVRNSLHEAARLRVRTDTVINRIRAEAETTSVRDEAEYQIAMDRADKRASIRRRTPMEIEPSTDAVKEELTALFDQAIAITASGKTEEPKPATQGRPTPSIDGTPGEPVDSIDAIWGESHGAVTYYLRNGDRIKIGTTTNLKRRVISLSLRMVDVARVEHGWIDHERRMHRKFDAYRFEDTEWFSLSGDLADYLGLSQAHTVLEPTLSQTELSAQRGELATAGSSSEAKKPQVGPSEPVAHQVAPAESSFGFSAHLSAQSAQRAKSVAQVVELLKEDRGITSAQVAERLNVSPATAKRYLREARQSSTD